VAEELFAYSLDLVLLAYHVSSQTSLQELKKG